MPSEVPSQNMLRSLPAAFQACLDGWESMPLDDEESVLVTEEEFKEEYENDKVLSTFMHYAESMESSLEACGANNDAMGRYFALYPNVVIEKLVAYTSQELASRGHPRTNATELRRNIALVWARSRYNFSAKLLWENEFAQASEKHNFSLPSLDRFNQIMSSIRAYPVVGRQGGDDDVWNKRETGFKLMRQIEQDIFEPSVNILLNKTNGCITIDDDQHGSRAGDVDKKNLSDRKRNSEGPVSDGAADGATGVMYGMSIRAKGETDRENLDRLLGRLPSLTHTSHSVESTFDRGYGKMPNIQANASKGYNFFTMAAAAGSRHPWLTKEEVDKKVAEWRKSGKTGTWINNRLNLLKDWILPEGTPHLGSVVKVAKKELLLDDGKKINIYAIAIHEVHDPKSASKWLRMFAAGEIGRQIKNVFVATKKDSGISSSTLWSMAKTPNQDRKEVEDTLNPRSGPVSIDQRSGGWFEGKGNRISGTMGGSLYNSTSFEEDATKQKLLEKCITSWHGRFKGNENMRAGSLNEEPVIENLQERDWMQKFYDIGCIELTAHPYIAVSPDGIAKIKTSEDGSGVLACVEIKTRMKEETTIARAEAVAAKHGTHVECVYGDEVCTDCIPSTNRTQGLHQVFVTGLDRIVYTISKIVDDEGSIVQTLIVKVPQEARDEYGSNVVPKAKELVGWLHNPEAIARGQLTDEDFPDWVTDDQKVVLKSRYPLWAAHEKKIKSTDEDGSVTYTSLYPVHVFKHGYQYKYNGGKWGIDKNTEMRESLKISAAILFEPKYVYIMLAAVLVGLWRVEQATLLVKPYVRKFRNEHGGENPTASQIRNKLRELPFDDFVRNFSYKCLHHLELPTLTINIPGSPVRAIGAGAAAARSQMDVAVSSIISRMGRRWPVNKDRAARFASSGLTLLRTHKSEKYPHKPTKAPKTEENTRGRLTCCLCSDTNNKRSTTIICATCEVPLCVELLEGEAESHFVMWHNKKGGNLMDLHKQCVKNLIEVRKESKKRRSTTAIDLDQPAEGDDNAEGGGIDQPEEGDGNTEGSGDKRRRVGEQKESEDVDEDNNNMDEEDGGNPTAELVEQARAASTAGTRVANEAINHLEDAIEERQPRAAAIPPQITCCALAGCGMKGERVVPGHKCIKCRGNMHGGLCGVQWYRRAMRGVQLTAEDLSIHAKGFADSTNALLCNSCITLAAYTASVTEETTLADVLTADSPTGDNTPTATADTSMADTVTADTDTATADTATADDNTAVDNTATSDNTATAETADDAATETTGSRRPRRKRTRVEGNWKLR